MQIEILKHDKNDFEARMDNLTVAEILRVYLNKEGIDFAAWKREHPTKPLVFKIMSSGKTVKKSVSEAVEQIKKDLEKLESSLKK